MGMRRKGVSGPPNRKGAQWFLIPEKLSKEPLRGVGQNAQYLNNERKEEKVMEKTASAITKSITLLFLTLLVVGCSSWTVIKDRPVLSESVSETSMPVQQTQPAFLKDYRGITDGVESNINQDFVNRFLNAVGRTGLFTPVRAGAPDQGVQRYVTMALTVREGRDTHQGDAAWKGALMGLSLYLLAPVLPLQYDFDSQMDLTVALIDGRKKQYTARGSGTANFHIFANAPRAGQDVEGQVTSANINSLMNQIIKDSVFYRP